jgi:hypothetical protein
VSGRGLHWHTVLTVDEFVGHAQPAATITIYAHAMLAL